MTEPQDNEFKCKARGGLYILVIIAMMSSCDAETISRRIESKVNQLEKKITLILEKLPENPETCTKEKR